MFLHVFHDLAEICCSSQLLWEPLLITYHSKQYTSCVTMHQYIGFLLRLEAILSSKQMSLSMKNVRQVTPELPTTVCQPLPLWRTAPALPVQVFCSGDVKLCNSKWQKGADFFSVLLLSNSVALALRKQEFQSLSALGAILCSDHFTFLSGEVVAKPILFSNCINISNVAIKIWHIFLTLFSCNLHD